MAKIKDEQLQQINNLKTTFNQIVFRLGQVEIETKDLEAEKAFLINQFNKNTQIEKELLESIQKEFGEGNLDLNTGEFTPNVSN